MTHYLGAMITGSPIRYESNENYNRIIKGQFSYEDDDKPYAEKKVNIFIQGWFGRFFIGKVRTDEGGKFKFKCHWECGWFSNLHVILAIMKKARPFSNYGVLCAKKTVSVEEIHLKTSAQTFIIDAGEYALKKQVQPKDLTKVATPTRIQMQSPDYFFRFAKAVFPEAVKRLVVNIAGGRMSLETVQYVFDLVGKQYDHYPNTAGALIHCLMNTVCAVPYRLEDNLIVWEALWDKSPLTGNPLKFDKEDALPNVRVFGKKDTPQGPVKLHSIEIKFRSDSDWKVVNPDDELLEWAVYVAKSVFALKGEAEEHLAKGHLLLGIDAEKFQKYISPGNPLYKVLSPHLDQVEFINWIGSMGIIFDNNSVLESLTALTGESLGEVFVSAVVRNGDYTRKDHVQEPLCEEHTKAHAEMHHLSVLKDYVDQVLIEDGEKIAEPKYWKEIHDWTDSVYKRCQAIPRVTESEDGPQNGDMERLKARVGRLLFLATLGHGGVHAGQGVLTNVFSASMGMNNRALKEGKLATDGNTDPRQGAYGIFIARTLMNFETDKLIDNRHGAVDPRLLAIVNKRREGYPPHILKMIPEAVQI